MRVLGVSGLVVWSAVVAACAPNPLASSGRPSPPAVPIIQPLGPDGLRDPVSCATRRPEDNVIWGYACAEGPVVTEPPGTMWGF